MSKSLEKLAFGRWEAQIAEGAFFCLSCAGLFSIISMFAMLCNPNKLFGRLILAMLAILLAWHGSVLATEQAVVASRAEVCKMEWEGKFGALSEIRPSRLAGLREMALRDGNVIFIDQSCEHVVIGEIVSRLDSTPAPERVKIDRSGIAFDRLIAVGPARPVSSWIFIVDKKDLPAFRSQMAQATRWDKAGYYVGLAEGFLEKGLGDPCRFEKSSLLSGSRFAMCAAKFGWEAVAGFTTPFAINQAGERLDFTWLAGFPVEPKK